jgi:hypothetical protein
MNIDKQNFSFIVFISVNSTINSASGSGIMYKTDENLYLITAKHVLFKNDGSIIGENIIITSKNFDETIETATIYEIQNFKICETILHGILDIVAVKIDLNDNIIVNNYINRPLVKKENIVPYDNISIFNEIYLAGFPTSLKVDITDYDLSKINFRKGIITSKYQNEFIVDSSTYYGMSGGAVFSINNTGNIFIIGIISKLVPLLVEWYNNREKSIINTDFENSGYSICIRIDDFINLLK